MQSIVTSMNELALVWADLAFVIFWQATAIGLLIGMIACTLPASSPAARCWFWRILALKLMSMPLWVVAVPAPSWLPRWNSSVHTAPFENEPPRLASNTGLANITRPEIARDTPSSLPISNRSSALWSDQIEWPTWLLLLWLCVVVSQMLRIAVQWNRLSRLLVATKVADETVIGFVASAAARLGLHSIPDVRLTKENCSPFVCGVWHIQLVLPQDLIQCLDERQLQHVLLHELSHIKRRDLAWGWVNEAARMLYFFHPIAHWMYYRMRLERELACDQLAMAASENSVPDYADTLVEVAVRSSQLRASRCSLVA